MALEILYCNISLRFDLRSRVMASEVGNGPNNHFSVCLEIPANNFRTNLATRKMFTPLCFFCQGTPNYVYIDLKRSLSNLTLAQGKFGLRSMSKMSKLCQVADMGMTQFFYSNQLSLRKF